MDDWNDMMERETTELYVAAVEHAERESVASEYDEERDDPTFLDELRYRLARYLTESTQPRFSLLNVVLTMVLGCCGNHASSNPCRQSPEAEVVEVTADLSEP